MGQRGSGSGARAQQPGQVGGDLVVAGEERHSLPTLVDRLTGRLFADATALALTSALAGADGVAVVGLGSVGHGYRAAQQAQGVGQFAEHRRGHRVPVDLAGLVAAGQRGCGGHHVQLDLHRRVEPRPQDQVGQAVDHPLLLAAPVSRGRARLRVALQRVAGGQRHRSGQGRGQGGVVRPPVPQAGRGRVAGPASTVRISGVPVASTATLTVGPISLGLSP